MLDPALWLAALIAGLGLEALIGDPRRWHPLAGFGWIADFLRQRLNCGSMRFVRGFTGWIILIVGGLGLFALLDSLLGFWAHALALWFALGAKSLRAHVLAIATPLEKGDLLAARLAVSQIVSRDCTELNEEGVARAALESTLENGSDAIFATLFWFALLGGWGAVLHRLANTLDAMWGYRTVELEWFGKAAARIDDALNFIPARLTALSYALLGKTRQALAAWRDQARLWDSPNAGPVMAAGAGALNVSLGGDAIYHGRIETRPVLGAGPRARAADIRRGVGLVTHTFVLWLVLLLTWGAWRC